MFPAVTSAQENFNVTAGIGLPEMLNLGLRMQFGQKEVGLAVGMWPDTSEDVFTVSGDFYYHFGGNSEYTSLRPWFLKTGLTYLKAEDEWERENTFVLVPRIGREFNISSRFGIAVEAGLLVIISDETKVKKERPSSWFGNLDLNFDGSLLPAAGINLYYRL